MRICLFTPTFLPKMGGQEMVVDQLARQYTALGHEVVVLAQDASRRGTKTEVTTPYRLQRFAKPFSQVWGISGMRRALAALHRSWPYEIVHSHSCYPTGYSALDLCRKKNIPLVVTSHGGDLAEDSRFRGRSVIMQRCKQTLEQADAVTFISSYMQKIILEIAPNCVSRLHPVPNGVNCAELSEKVLAPPALAQRHKLQTDKFILFLGRLHRRKGVDILIRAFQKAAEKNLDLHLVIAGEGEESSALQQQNQQSSVAERIHFVGAVHGVNKLWLLQNALCLVLPTRTRETFGLVLLEAMVCGKPVIGTKLGGILDLIEQGKNGFLVEPNDAEDLADAIEKIQNPALREAFSHNCLTSARGYDWSQVAKKYLSLLEGLLAKNFDRVR